MSQISHAPATSRQLLAGGGAIERHRHPGAQLIYVSTPAKFTVPLALRAFLDSSGQSQWGPMFAMSLVTLVPVVVVFVVFQRRIVEGLATSGIK